VDAKPVADDFPELVADLGRVCASGVGVEIEAMELPRSLPARRIMAEDPHLVPRLAGAGDNYALVFALPPDASPVIECLVPELALAIIATGAIETQAGVRLVDANRKRAPITVCRGQHF
jgi:thiamine monophosphate kinase